MVSHTKKSYKIRYNSRYNTLGRTTQLYLLLFQIGLIVAGLIVYFLNKPKNSKRFYDLVLNPIITYDTFNNVESFQNNENQNIIYIEDDIDDVSHTYHEDILIKTIKTYDPRNHTNQFIVDVMDQKLCGSCNFFALSSLLSDNLNKKHKRYKKTYDCIEYDSNEKEQIIISVQDLIDKFLRNTNNVFNNWCSSEFGGSTYKDVYNVITSSQKPNYLIENACNLYKLSDEYNIEKLFTLFTNVEKEEFQTNNDSNKSNNQLNDDSNDVNKKQKTIIKICLVVSLIVILFLNYYILKFSSSGIKYVFGLLFLIVKGVILLLIASIYNSTVRTRLKEFAFKYLDKFNTYYLLGSFIIFALFTLLNITNSSINLVKYYKYKYKYNIHQHIITILLLIISSCLVYLLDYNRRKLNEAHINYENTDIKSSSEFDTLIDYLNQFKRNNSMSAIENQTTQTNPNKQENFENQTNKTICDNEFNIENLDDLLTKNAYMIISFNNKTPVDMTTLRAIINININININITNKKYNTSYGFYNFNIQNNTVSIPLNTYFNNITHNHKLSFIFEFNSKINSLKDITVMIEYNNNYFYNKIKTIKTLDIDGLNMFKLDFSNTELCNNYTYYNAISNNIIKKESCKEPGCKVNSTFKNIKIIKPKKEWSYNMLNTREFYNNYEKYSVYVKYLIITYGGVCSRLDIYNKDYFEENNIYKSYYIPPLDTSYTTEGGHAIHIIGWINITENNYTTIKGFDFSEFEEYDDDIKYGDYWIVKNSWSK
jgi:hypothetical protein